MTWGKQLKTYNNSFKLMIIEQAMYFNKGLPRAVRMGIGARIKAVSGELWTLSTQINAKFCIGTPPVFDGSTIEVQMVDQTGKKNQ